MVANDKLRDEAISRAVAIARSCRTREQLNVARQYARRIRDAYGDCDGHRMLIDVIKATDRKLFPGS